MSNNFQAEIFSFGIFESSKFTKLNDISKMSEESNIRK